MSGAGLRTTESTKYAAGRASNASYPSNSVGTNSPEPAVSSVIAGPRTLQQWQDYLPALVYRVTAEDEALVDSLVRPGHPSTPGYTDPAYPLNGRSTAG